MPALHGRFSCCRYRAKHLQNLYQAQPRVDGVFVDQQRRFSVWIGTVRAVHARVPACRKGQSNDVTHPCPVNPGESSAVPECRVGRVWWRAPPEFVRQGWTWVKGESAVQGNIASGVSQLQRGTASHRVHAQGQTITVDKAGVAYSDGEVPHGNARDLPLARMSRVPGAPPNQSLRLRPMAGDRSAP
jgi:hypothetical protein